MQNVLKIQESFNEASHRETRKAAKLPEKKSSAEDILVKFAYDDHLYAKLEAKDVPDEIRKLIKVPKDGSWMISEKKETPSIVGGLNVTVYDKNNNIIQANGVNVNVAFNSDLSEFVKNRKEAILRDRKSALKFFVRRLGGRIKEELSQEEWLKEMEVVKFISEGIRGMSKSEFLASKKVDFWTISEVAGLDEVSGHDEYIDYDEALAYGGFSGGKKVPSKDYLIKLYDADNTLVDLYQFPTDPEKLNRSDYSGELKRY